MRTIILLLFCVCSLQCKASFWGVEFGTSKDSAAKYFKQHHRLSPLTKEDKEDCLVYYNVMLGEYLAETVMLYFNNNRFCKAVVNYPTLADSTLRMFRNIEHKLTQRYGPAIQKTQVDTTLTNPKVNDKLIYAIKGKKVVFRDLWKSAKYKTNISFIINPNLYLQLTYSDPKVVYIPQQTAGKPTK